jgi:hypothetical protein
VLRYVPDADVRQAVGSSRNPSLTGPSDPPKLPSAVLFSRRQDQMRDVATWLAGMGLERYAAAFAANEIDFAALPHLIEDDLKELG